MEKKPDSPEYDENGMLLSQNKLCFSGVFLNEYGEKKYWDVWLNNIVWHDGECLHGGWEVSAGAYPAMLTYKYGAYYEFVSLY